MHGDNIFISHNSPECLDEPFWIKDNKNYFRDPLNSNIKHQITILEAYGNFLNKHALVQGKNIVIKNNNNHIRLLHSNYFKDSVFIVLFIKSYLSILITIKTPQTMIFKKDNIFDYMNYIGHREFGLNQSI